jgi:hypothetical protein
VSRQPGIGGAGGHARGHVGRVELLPRLGGGAVRAVGPVAAQVLLQLREADRPPGGGCGGGVARLQHVEQGEHGPFTVRLDREVQLVAAPRERPAAAAGRRPGSSRWSPRQVGVVAEGDATAHARLQLHPRGEPVPKPRGLAHRRPHPFRGVR